MFKKYKQLVIGIILGALIFGGVSVATTGLKSIDVTYNNIKIAVDGKEIKTDSEPFVYEGSTYVPIRVVSESLGADVNWNTKTKTVEISGRNSLIEVLKSEKEQLKLNLEEKQVIINSNLEKLKEYETIINNINTSTINEKVKEEVTTPVIAPETKEVTVYVTKTGAKYHSSGCRYLSKSRIPMDLSRARKNYSPCSVCNPPR